jgi:hypothetical protein
MTALAFNGNFQIPKMSLHLKLKIIDLGHSGENSVCYRTIITNSTSPGNPDRTTIA